MSRPVFLEDRQPQLSVSGGCFLGGDDDNLSVTSVARTKEQAEAAQEEGWSPWYLASSLFYGHPGAQFAAEADE